MQIVRARIQSNGSDNAEGTPIDKRTALYIFFSDNRLQKMDTMISAIDEKCRDTDGFLYGVFTSQEVFGQ